MADSSQLILSLTLLKGHIDFTHEGKKGWECEQCQTHFKAKSSLEQHIKAVHIGTRDHICFLCGKAFVRQSDLNTHLRGVHESTKRYQCQSCEKSYKTKQILEKHIEAVHEGNKPAFKCQLCDKDFASPHTLKCHIEVIHEKKKAWGGCCYFLPFHIHSIFVFPKLEIAISFHFHCYFLPLLNPSKNKEWKEIAILKLLIPSTFY